MGNPPPHDPQRLESIHPSIFVQLIQDQWRRQPANRDVPDTHGGGGSQIPLTGGLEIKIKDVKTFVAQRQQRESGHSTTTTTDWTDGHSLWGPRDYQESTSPATNQIDVFFQEWKRKGRVSERSQWVTEKVEGERNCKTLHLKSSWLISVVLTDLKNNVAAAIVILPVKDLFGQPKATTVLHKLQVHKCTVTACPDFSVSVVSVA